MFQQWIVVEFLLNHKQNGWIPIFFWLSLYLIFIFSAWCKSNTLPLFQYRMIYYPMIYYPMIYYPMIYYTMIYYTMICSHYERMITEKRTAITSQRLVNNLQRKKIQEKKSSTKLDFVASPLSMLLLSRQFLITPTLHHRLKQRQTFFFFLPRFILNPTN